MKQEPSPYSRDGEMCTQVGPTVILKQDVAQAIAVALHELATNAQSTVLYPRRKVRFVSSVARSRRTGRTALDRARRSTRQAVDAQGFWHPVMDAMIRGHVAGDVRLAWRAEGLACERT
jgi:hypothetical protein